MKALNAPDVSGAWLAAVEFLLATGGEATHLTVAVGNPLQEDQRVREAIDSFVGRKRQGGSLDIQPVRTVANTIFPEALYHPRLGARAAAHLYETYAEGFPISRRRNHSDTYFGRLIAYPGPRGPVNQLDQAITRLKQSRAHNHRKGSRFELSIPVLEVASDDGAAVLVYAAGKDNRTRGFPCLSHLSLTLSNGRLNMVAVYRNHHFVRRAYGNYLALGQLLRFIARESGWEVGELLCISSHAEVESDRREIRTLVGKCRAAIEEAV